MTGTSGTLGTAVLNELLKKTYNCIKKVWHMFDKPTSYNKIHKNYVD